MLKVNLTGCTLICALFIWSIQDYDAFFAANENVAVHEFLKLDPEISNGQNESVSITMFVIIVSQKKMQ